MSEGTDLLTTGLNEGYTGKTEIDSVDRGGFTLKSSEFQSEEGKYIDQWIPARTGAGQELAITADNEKWTRVYAGGVIAPEKLEPLGLTEDQVIGYLIGTVNKLGQKTRLHEECVPKADGEWQYAYRITDKFPDVELTRTLETIHFRGTRVFLHGFMICEVKDSVEST